MRRRLWCVSMAYGINRRTWPEMTRRKAFADAWRFGRRMTKVV